MTSVADRPQRPADGSTGIGVYAPGRARIVQRTLRTDSWRRPPLTVAGILGFFVVYTLIRIFMNKWYFVEDYHYLTPVYSPCLSQSCPVEASDFGQEGENARFMVEVAAFRG